jgi:CHRD domain-containing protein
LKVRTLISAAIAVGLVALTAAAGAGSQASVRKVNASAAMNAGQEVPAPSASAANAKGAFTATVTSDGTGATFTWKLVFTDLTGPATAAHLHVAARKEAGDVIVGLCGPCTNGQTGSGKLEEGDVSALRAGRVYVNIHTARNPDGEVRGQLDIVDKQEVPMTAGQETHSLKGNVSKAKGGFTATVTREGRGTELRWRLGWEGLTGRAQAAHIHLGKRGKSGAVIIFLCGTAKKPCINKRGGVAKLTFAQAQALENGNIYVNVHTAKNPAGEIRGQLRAARLWIRP